ncbi:MAG: GMC family oxidoreductase [Myxococcales bacterium]|nr:GMC family oxidoreductase [Myxococcales bacterium]MCB9626755.1 GMC family oxidoreductase [Sandaracinaceae bacterium]
MARFEIDDVADFVVVGTGAGGATAARVLSAAGHSVLMLEEGGWLRTEDRPRDMVGAMAASMRDAGAQATRDAAPMPLLQGVAVGGSTAINSGIIWRLPEDVRTSWTRDHGLGELVDARGLDAAFDAIERDLEVAETSDDLLGHNGGLMRTAAERRGLPGRAMVRNSKRCEGSGECLQGCLTEARRSMDVSYVPMAMRDGARLHTHCRVSHVERRWGRAVGVVGDVLGADRKPSGRFRVRARRGVIIAAGVLHTPVILLRSGLRGQVGKRFQAHPGSAIVGRFAHAVGQGGGATQAYEIPMRARGFKIESLSMPPEMLTARLPGVGAEWMERIAQLDHHAHWVAQCRFEAMGRVRVGFDGRPAVTYHPTARDVGVLLDGLALVAELMFEVGAEEVYPGVHGVPEVLRSVDEVAALRRPGITRADLHMVASHLFGTAVAGRSARDSVVGPSLEAHALRGLYVMDASVFPTNLGVNPQHSIMGVVHRASAQLANQERAGRWRWAS